MKRRDFLWVSAAGAAIKAGLATGQAPRVRRLGILSLIPFSDPPSPERQAFLQGLIALGYVPGKNLDIVYASAENAIEFLDDIARDLVARRPEVIAASGAISLEALQRATRDIPIVMLAVGDPVGMKVVKSLSRPGGNITGSSFISSELAAKRVQLLQEVMPGGRRLAVLVDARNAGARLESAAVVVAAHKLGLTPFALRYEDDRSLTAALHRAAAGHADLLYATFEGAIVARRRHEIAAFALQRKWPSIAGWSGIAEAGCLMSYAPDFPELFRRGAHFVQRILDGAKPADLPVEQASRFELVVNLKTAKELGLKFPQAILVRADRVIE